MISVPLFMKGIGAPCTEGLAYAATILEQQFFVEALFVSRFAELFTVTQPVLLQQSWPVLIISLGFMMVILAFLYQRQQFLRRTTEMEYSLKQTMNRSLGAQLTPHFLYNVLNTINGSIMKGDTDESMRIVGEFSKLMRVVFNNSRKNLVSVQEELDAVQSYVSLELSRLENGFGFETRCAAGAEHLFIPSLFIQPLVENSIWHGLSNIGYRGKVSLSIGLKDSLVEVCVRDNGKGFSEAAIAKVTSNQASALGVLFERMTLLKALYGPSVSMKIYSEREANPYTEVVLTFPQINMP